MTETEWQASSNSVQMVNFLLLARHQARTWRGRLRAWFGKQQSPLLSDRKVRLFLCACCQCHLNVFHRDVDRQILEATEQLAEYGRDGEKLWELAEHARSLPAEPSPPPPAWYVANACRWPHLLDSGWPMISGALCAIINTVGGMAFVGSTLQEQQANQLAAMDLESRKQAGLLRDIVGNTFRPITVDPAWRTSTVVSLAQGIYDARAFDRLPILADALEDAGCTNAEMLHHCRQPGEHVRGCWPVDLLLGKQ